MPSNPLFLNQLNPFARGFYMRLVQEFPDWVIHALVYEHDELLIEVPSLNPNSECKLRITADSYQVIVAFGGGHAHFSDWLDNRGEQSIYSEALKCIHEIIEVRLVGVTLKNGGGVLAFATSSSRETWITEIVTVISWNNTITQITFDDSPSFRDTPKPSL